ncbi:LCP family glycopolymer transferase [Streptodolium elevatio]
MSTGNGPRPGGRGDHNLDALNDADVADLWVMDPDTGHYRLRTPDASMAGDAAAATPAAGAGAPGRPGRPSAEDDPFDGLYRDSAANAANAANGVNGVTAAGGPGSRTVVPPRTAPDADPEPQTQPASPPRRPKSKAKKRLKWTAIGLAAVLVGLAAGAYGYYQYLNSRIKKTDRTASVEDIPKSAADPFGRRPLNVLLIGSDTRLGKGNQIGGEAGHPGLADTTILMHLSADRSNATMVSIPRDTMVDRPACKYDGGNKVQPASNGKVQFNSTLVGEPGAPCTVATVERMLRVQVDHYLMIDFNGVKEMTKAVGGVPINLCEAINDPVLPNKQGGTGLVLPAGEQRLAGQEALQFLRARHAFGDGSDLARIEAQKSFLMALAREIKSNAKWSNPKAVFDIANAAVDNLQVDRGLGTIDKLAGLGNEIKKVPEKRMAFTTLPVEPYPGNPDAWVQPRQPDADRLWRALETDTSVTAGAPAPAPTASVAAPPPVPVATVDPATIRVTVHNTTKASKGKAVADQLKALKYQASSVPTDDSRPRDNSVVKYPAGKIDAARQLARAVGLPETAVEENTTAGSTFELIIGSDFPDLTSPTAKIPAASAGKPTPPPAPVIVPPSADIKLNTADNTACISTGKKR